MKFSKLLAYFLLTTILLMTLLPIICYAGNVIIIEIEDRSGVYIDTCQRCGVTCDYIIEHEWWTKRVHCVRHWCSNCGYDQCVGTYAEKHLMLAGECYWCGWPNHKKYPPRDGGIDDLVFHK